MGISGAARAELAAPPQRAHLPPPPSPRTHARARSPHTPSLPLPPASLPRRPRGVGGADAMNVTAVDFLTHWKVVSAVLGKYDGRDKVRRAARGPPNGSEAAAAEGVH